MKLPLDSFQARSGLDRLLIALGSTEGGSRYVGGVVRDTLLGLPVSDIDIATKLVPAQVLERLERASIKAVPTGLAHGTVTAILSSGPVEITTLRRDVSTDGRRATVAFTQDWQEDAARRDFTINALFADPETGELFDYFGGLDDLEIRRVRFIGDPLLRIAEDHLRILRFFRFHARFGGEEPDAAALEACTARANDLMALSRERIQDELLKLLALPDPSATIRLMVERGILRPVLPEIGKEAAEALTILIRRERHCGVTPDPLRRLAALLPADSAVAGAVAARLRLSNKAAKRLVTAADRAGASERADVLAYRIGADEAADRLLLAGKEVPDLAEQIATLSGWQRPPFPLGGGDLIAMGLKPGPIVARTYQEVERDWIALGFPSDPDEVRRLAQARVDQALRDTQ